MSNYVVIKSEPSLYTVGFYAPNGEWNPHSDHTDKEEAEAKVFALNGGSLNLENCHSQIGIKISGCTVGEFEKVLLIDHENISKIENILVEFQRFDYLEIKFIKGGME